MHRCSHSTLTPAHTGALSTCMFCGLELIHDSTKWTWRYGIDDVKFRKLRTIFEIDQYSGKHMANVP